MPLNVRLEAPCAARVSERHEWEYGQRLHQAALQNLQKQGPTGAYSRPPKAQARVRQFSNAHREAAIGLENAKLIEKLEHIATGYTGADPRAPPSKKDYRKLPGPFVARRGERVSPSDPPKRVRSLNEPYRFKMQQVIQQDNEAFVRRLLDVGTTFDRRSEARDFNRHRRTVLNLQRFVDRSTLQSRSLPPLRTAARPSSTSSALGLESLLVPGDLVRLGSSPALLDRSKEERSSEMPSGSLAEPSSTDISDPSSVAELPGPALGSPNTAGGAPSTEGDAPSPTTENFESPGSSQLSPLTGKKVGLGTGTHSERDPRSPATVVQEDMSPDQGSVLRLGSPSKVPGSDPLSWGMDYSTEPTERRKWLSSDAGDTSTTQEATLSTQPRGGLSTIPSQQSLDNDTTLSGTYQNDNFASMNRGASSSEVGYSADWDENSMSGSSMPSPANSAAGLGNSPSGRRRPRRDRNTDPAEDSMFGY